MSIVSKIKWNLGKLSLVLALTGGVSAASFAADTAASPEAVAAQKLLSIVLTAKGLVLAGDNELSLYTFDPDVVGSGTSRCNDQCATAWPPALTQLESVNAPLSIVTRRDGERQLAYKGKPLYSYSQDSQLGDVNGDGVAGVWHLALLAP